MANFAGVLTVCTAPAQTIDCEQINHHLNSVQSLTFSFRFLSSPLKAFLNRRVSWTRQVTTLLESHSTFNMSNTSTHILTLLLTTTDPFVE